MPNERTMEKAELLSAMETRAKSLLVELESFKQIEEEYRSISKAIKVMRGEAIYNKAEQPAIANGAVAAEATVRRGDTLTRYLSVIAGAARGIRPSDIWRADGYGKIGTAYTNCKRLAKQGLVRSVRQHDNSALYFITEVGVERLSGGVSEKRDSVHAAATRFTTEAALRALVLMQHGGTVAEISDALGLFGKDRNKTSVGLPYLREQGLAKSAKDKDGRVIYSITPAGKSRVALSIGVGA